MRDAQDERPVATCGRCQGEVYHGEAMYLWNGKWVCVDCLRAAVEALLEDHPRQVAADMMLDVQEV